MRLAIPSFRSCSIRQNSRFPPNHAKLSFASVLRPEPPNQLLKGLRRYNSTSSHLDITGNASQRAKQICFDNLNHIVDGAHHGCSGFAHAVGKRLRVTQVDVTNRPDAPIRKEVRVVCEITIEPDMVNTIGTLHGGCSAFLVDDCSSLPISVMGHELHNSPVHGVSQTISTFYHAPAFVGAELRIISTSLTYGARIMSSRCEIWDKNNQRLVVSGVHTMMQPSPSNSAA